MFKRGAPTSEIIKRINSSEEGFELFPDGAQRLLKQGVPKSVIDAMFAKNSRSPEPPSDIQKNSYQQKRRQNNQAPLIVKESTPVRLRLLDNLSSANLRLGDKVHFEVLEDVHATDGAARPFLVIRREAPADGTITAINQTKVMGRYGTVQVALDHVMLANEDAIALRGTERADRHIRPGLVVFLLAPVGMVVQPKDPVWLSFLGKDAMIADGTDFTVWTDGVADLDSSEFEQR